MAGNLFWDKMVLGLHCDGTNGSTTFTDVKGKTVTANGNAQISTAQYPALTGKTSSAYFDGNGDYLSIPDSADWDFGSGDFTIRFRVRLPSSFSSQGAVFVQRANNTLNSPIWIGVTAAKLVRVIASSATTTTLFDVTGTTVLVANTWYHVAFVRYGSSWKVYIDGAEELSQTNAGAVFSAAANVVVGGDTNTNYLNGYLSEVEIYKGGALHVEDFTPPTDPFDEGYLPSSGALSLIGGSPPGGGASSRPLVFCAC